MTKNKLTKKEMSDISSFIINLLFKAEKVYGNKYYKFSIQIEKNKAYIIGHETVSYEPDYETTLCNVIKLLNNF